MGKFNGRLTQLRQTNAGIGRYTWRTSDDERVRKDHRDLGGMTQEWADPSVTNQRRGETNHPGADLQRRYWAGPIIADLL